MTVEEKENNVAIENNYLSTYGWEVDDAYYKISSVYEKIEPDDPSDNNYRFGFEVFRNKAARIKGDAPLMKNFNFPVEIDNSKFDKKKTDDSNRIAQAYEALKNYTNSFKTEGKDV